MDRYNQKDIKRILIYSSLLLFFSISFIHTIRAQSFEPRILSDIPIKGNVFLASYAYSKGDILLDGASPVQDLESSVNSLVFAYARTFKLFNKLTKIDAIIPYAFADFSGKLNDVAAATSRTGFGDPMIRFFMIFIGSDPLELKDFVKHKPDKFKFGAGIRISPPLGQYDNSKIINLGTNRWTFKIGVGASYTFINKIILEGQIKSWLFTKNDDFFNGGTVSQNPLFSAQLHLTYIFKPGIWLSGSIGQTNSGVTYINGVEQEKINTNTKYGLTFSYRLNKKNGLKFALTNGVPNQYAFDYTSIIIFYNFIWFDKK